MELRKQLLEAFEQLPVEQQHEVVEYAVHLLQPLVEPDDASKQFYICPICFSVSAERVVCHGRHMVACHADSPDDCKPLMDADGELKTRAPRWFVRATSA